MNISQLEPQQIWTYFEEITKIPRPSKKEEKINQYLLDFAKQHQLEALKDSANNIIIRKPAFPGMENVKSVILQSHSDMVCEKNTETIHNFDTDPIKAYVDGDWIKADGTTLGGDDGIGIAATLAVLASKTLKHGPIEALFTADEETGMSGAFGLENGILRIDTEATFYYNKKEIPTDSIAFKISVTGLKGGHSGDEIDKGLGNSNKIMNRILQNLSNYKIRLSDFSGGNLRNAIPREAFSIITIPQNNSTEFKSAFEALIIDIKKEIETNEPDLSIVLSETKLPEFVINKSVQKKLINAIYSCWHGVYAMSADMPGLVETSTNLASVKFEENNKIIIATSQRSSSLSARADIAATVKSTFKLAGAKVKQGDGYPGWKPNVKSEIMQITKQAHIKLFNQEPVVRAIHAGLECGLFLTKYPDLDMVSFGPTIKGAHSPAERMHIPAVKRFWELLVEVLKNIPTK